MTETEIVIASCPKCGATVTVERWSGDDEKVMGFHCPTCGFMYLAHGDLTDEENISKWNDQPVIQRLRAGIQNTLDLARTGLKPDHYATEQEWLQHQVNVIARELAQLLK